MSVQNVFVRLPFTDGKTMAMSLKNTDKIKKNSIALQISDVLIVSLGSTCMSYQILSEISSSNGTDNI